jgi:Family of unknown function (DUF6584)
MPKGAIEKAKEDVKRGDHWLARQRLDSYLQTTGYDMDVVAELGRISLEMHNAFDAGRYWLTSAETGEDIDGAINLFLRHAGKDRVQAVKHLPKAVRLETLASYPKVAQDRLRTLGLDELVLFDRTTSTVAKNASGLIGTLVGFAIFLGILLAVFVFCLRCQQVFELLFD